MKKDFLKWFYLLFLFLGLAFVRENKDIKTNSNLYWYCPFCHGQALLESDHPEALALVDQIELWKKEGHNQATIEKNLHDSYGSLMFRSQGPKALMLMFLSLWWYNKIRSGSCD